MKKEFSIGCAALALVGVALAQVEATSSSTYFIDIDPARYNGPPAQRIVMQIGDHPRHVTLNSKDEICVQLSRSSDTSIISARVRVLRPEPHDAAEVKVAGPGISPGTYRSTPWGMLLRVVPEKNLTLQPVQTLGTTDSPVCSL